MSELAKAVARRALISVSPVYAEKRFDELLAGWWLDIKARPEVYRDAIENAPPSHQTILRDILPHIIEVIEATGDDERIAIDRKYAIEIARAEAAGDLWALVWLELYFVPGSDLAKEFTVCAQALAEDVHRHS